ncbi:hypothetical protein AB0C12_07190 [Actinoplanes sp. NPDC048967]|uniref:hypothetical protein n=1 Tax=Actinoplanes sp. NPDC048967 TaxID=3155269 RepID=UPI0033E2C00E
MAKLRTIIGTGITAALAVSIAGGPGRPATDTIELVSRDRAHDHPSEPFAIMVKGRPMKHLYPGITRELQLTLRNPYDFALSVKSLRADVVSSSKRRCKPVPANLVARAYTGKLPLLIPPRSRTDAKTIPLTMPPGAAQACSGATFTIQLRGTATKAYR